MTNVPFFPLLSAVLAGTVVALALNISEKNTQLKEKDARIAELEKELRLPQKNGFHQSKTSSASKKTARILSRAAVENLPEAAPDGGRRFTPKQIEDRLKLHAALSKDFQKILNEIANNDEKLVERWTQEFALSQEQVSRLHEKIISNRRLLEESWRIIGPQLAAARDLTAEEAKIEDDIFSNLRQNSIHEFLKTILTEEQAAVVSGGRPIQ